MKSWFNSNLNIGTRLVVAFIFMASIIAIVGYIGLQNVRDFSEVNQKIYNENLQPIAAVTKIVEQFQKTRVLVRDALLANNLKDLENIRQKFVELEAENAQTNEQYQSIFSNDEQKNTFAEYKKKLAAYYSVRNTMMQLLQEGKKEEARLLLNQAIEISKLVEANIAKLVQINTDVAQKANANMLAQKDYATKLILSFIIGGIIIAILLGYIIARSITKPIKELDTAVQRISKGDLNIDMNYVSKDEIGSLSSSFNSIKTILQSLVAEVFEMSRQHDAGIISYQIPADKFQGEYREMVQAINALVKSHIAVKMRVVEVISQYAVGNFALDMDRLPGEKAKITESIDGVKASLQAINKEILMLAQQAAAGQLNARGNASKFQYTFREMVEGMNATLDAVVKPFTMAATYLERISRGDIPGRVTENYNGEFATLKDNVNLLIDTLNAMTKAQQELSRQHNELGLISYRMPVEQFKGAFAEMISSMNALVQAHIAVKMRVVEVISQYAAGNFALDMDRLPGEKAKITESIDGVKASLKAVNEEILVLAQQAVEGQLSARGNASKFQYTFREMIEGINMTLDAMVGPIDEAVTVLQRMAEGDLSTTMVGTYQGDHAILKTALNTTIALMPFKEAIAVLEELATGNFTVAMHGEYKGDSLALKNALNQTIVSVKQTLLQVAAAAQQVSIGAEQVASSNMELAQGAQTQASSLEEVSASMQEISIQAKANASNAAQANTIVRDSHQTALLGTTEMQRLNDAMNQMSDSSRSISKIINTTLANHHQSLIIIGFAGERMC